jgi:hypothetical protein
VYKKHNPPISQEATRTCSKIADRAAMHGAGPARRHKYPLAGRAVELQVYRQQPLTAMTSKHCQA